MSKYIQSLSDGASSPAETNDCTVRALANAAIIPYGVAHAFLKAEGRINRKGSRCTQSYAAYIKAGLVLKSIHGGTVRARALTRCSGLTAKRGVTLGTLLPKLSKGRYVVVVTGHALAVVNGQVIDGGPNRAGKQVYGLYKVK